MKRTIILTIVLVGCLQVALAQNTIESIRKAYQAQQAEIAEMAEDFPYDGYPPCYYQLSVVMNLPATGLHRENIRMYFGEMAQDDEDNYNPYPPHYLSFLTTKFDGQKLLRLNVKKSDDLKSYDDTAIKVAGFKDVFTGTSIPEAYKEFCDMYQKKAQQYLSMFNSIDGTVY